MIIKAKSLIFVLSYTPLLLISYCLSSSSQTLFPSSFSIVENVIQPNSPSVINAETRELQPQDQNTFKMIEAQSVAETLLATGVSAEAITISMDLVQAGADTVLVTNLMLTLNGLAADKKTISNAQVNRAITNYNAIVNTSDLLTLKKLKMIPAFIDIRLLLERI